MKNFFWFFFFLIVQDLAQAKEQVISGQKMLDTETDTLWRLQFSGLFDARIVHTGIERNWQNLGPSFQNSVGGAGLTRYGGIDDDGNGRGNRSSNLIRLPQAILVTDVMYGSDFGAHLQLNHDDAEEGSSDVGSFGVAEAYIAHQQDFAEVYSLRERVGLLFPPISLEHINTAWSTEYTVTPSSINTWIGEEIRPTAVELNLKRKTVTDEWNYSAAAFSGNDTAGNILAYRGWAMHDLQARKGLRLRTQEHVSAASTRTTDPMAEVDGKLGAYGLISYSRSKFDLRFFAYLNGGDGSTRGNLGDGSWKTKFYVSSLKFNISENLVLLSQYLWGNTKMFPSPNVINDDFVSYYVMLSYKWNKERITARYDDFRIDDKDFPADLEGQTGQAVTIAYFHHFNSAHQLGAEYLRMKSSRPGNSGFGTQDPDDDLAQLAYRFYF